MNYKHKYILFDLDGTLDDPFDGITGAVQYAMAKFGVKTEKENLKCFIGPPLAESFMKYFGLDEENAKTAVEYYREYYRPKGIFEIKVYEGIPELLGRLHEAGCELILATSKPTVFADMILEKFGMKQYFAAVFGSELDGRRVKKGEVIAYALENYPIDIKEAIMVGDRFHDIVGAHENGIPCICVTFGYGSREEFMEHGAEYIVDTVSELEAIL